MNIEEIRAEIQKVFDDDWHTAVEWIRDQGVAWPVDGGTSAEDYCKVTEILVDRAYEAGQNSGANYDRGVKYGYDKGFEAGKAEAIVVPDNAAIAKAENEGWDCGYDVGYEAAAKNPKAWYVLDKNGEQVHIGDTVIVSVPNYQQQEWRVFNLGENEVCNGFRDKCYARYIEKVTPDTREKVKEELIRCLAKDTDEVPDDITCGDLAEQFISRIEALGE